MAPPSPRLKTSGATGQAAAPTATRREANFAGTVLGGYRQAGLQGTVWITGPPAAGKTTLAGVLQTLLRQRGVGVVVLDGDQLRAGLSEDLGLSRSDRSEQARRAAHVAALIAQSGLVAIVALVSPYRDDRARARALHAGLGMPFVEVWLDTPLSVRERRDPKGLYEQQRSGQLRRLSGVDAPYEEPDSAELRIVGTDPSLSSAQHILVVLRGKLVPTTLRNLESSSAPHPPCASE